MEISSMQYFGNPITSSPPHVSGQTPRQRIGPSSTVSDHRPRSLNALYARRLAQYILAWYPHLENRLSDEHRGHGRQNDPAQRCTLAGWQDLIDVCSRQSPSFDPVLGLAERLQPWCLGLPGALLMSSATVGDLIKLVDRFHPLLNDVFTVEHGMKGRLAFLQLHPTCGERSDHLARLLLLQLVHLMRFVVDRSDLAAEAYFTGPPPQASMPYRRMLGGSARFDQAANMLSFDAAYLDLPVVYRDDNLHAVLMHQAVQLLARIAPGDASFEERLRSLVKANLACGADHKTVAAAMNLTKRSLQRRIQSAAIDFRNLVEEEKRRQAMRCLRETEMTMSDIAASLGFSEHSAFSRSFKRWTGLSPTVYRRLKNPTWTCVEGHEKKEALASLSFVDASKVD
jgi:AraC-like DNA-binding protein